MPNLETTATILDQADFELGVQEVAYERVLEKMMHIATLQRQIDDLPQDHEVTLADYAGAEGSALDAHVTRRHKQHTSIRHEVVEVSGTVRQNGLKAEVPMYRVTEHQPRRDTNSSPLYYTVEVADPESEIGYSPILFASTVSEKVASTSNISEFAFRYDGKFTSEQQAALLETSMYIDPRATDMLAEVEDILDTAVMQHYETQQLNEQFRTAETQGV